VSSWNATVSEFSKLPLPDLQHDWSGTTPIFEVMFVPSSTLTVAFQPSGHFRERFSPDPSSLDGSEVQTTVQESGYTRLQLTRYWNGRGSQTHSYYSLVMRRYRYHYRYRRKISSIGEYQYQYNAAAELCDPW